VFQLKCVIVLKYIVIVIITFMQGIYTYIPETNYVPREYSVAVILLLLFMVHRSLAAVLNLLHFYISYAVFQSKYLIFEKIYILLLPPSISV
jgi:hypothetical protein